MAMTVAGFGGDRAEFFSHFFGVASDDTPIGLTTQDTSATGTPVFSFQSASGGVYRCAHDSEAEVQSIGLHAGDVLWVNPTKSPVFEARVARNSATPSADQRLVIGLAAAYDGTLDDNTHHVWFREDGANQNILWESDDATTDDDDNDTGVDWTTATFQVFRIDMSNLATTELSIDGELVATVDMSELTASNLLQPMIILQKDGGAETDSVDVDYIYVGQDL